MTGTTRSFLIAMDLKPAKSTCQALLLVTGKVMVYHLITTCKKHWNYSNLLSIRKTKTCLLQKEGFTTPRQKNLKRKQMISFSHAEQQLKKWLTSYQIMIFMDVQI